MGKVPIEEMIRLYREGAFQDELAERYGVSQTTIWKLLNDAGVRRTSGESRRLRWERMTPEQRFAQLEAAHIASTRKREHWELTERALRKQATPTLSELETRFAEAFRISGLPVVPQYALDIYNIDFALPDQKIAVEIDGGNWHSTDKHQRGDKGKEVMLRNRGWKLIRFKVDLIHGRITQGTDMDAGDVSKVLYAIYSNPAILR